MTAGYSGTPLVKKLGIKEGQRCAFLGVPDQYFEIELPQLPEIVVEDWPSKDLDFVQVFYRDGGQLQGEFPSLAASLHKQGMLWISWPKKSSKLAADIDENRIREIGLENGTVDVKVCAVNADWSGLKFVFWLKDRRSFHPFWLQLPDLCMHGAIGIVCARQVARAHQELVHDLAASEFEVPLEKLHPFLLAERMVGIEPILE
jgi:hypothetical protein